MFHSWLKKIKKWFKEDILIKLSFTLIIILSFVLIIVSNLINSLKEEAIEQKYDQTYQVLEIGLIEYNKRLELDLDNKVQLIFEQAQENYSDPEQLKHDILNLDSSNTFVNIVRNLISNDENILLVSADKVLMGNFKSYNMNSVRNNNFFNISMENFYQNFNNSALVQDTMEKIFSMQPLTDNKLLGFEKNTSDLQLKEFDLNEIFELISNNPSKINDLYFISCSYITETGDIFSNPDYDLLGNPNKNMKMVLIKLYSFSDLDSTLIKHEVESLTKEIRTIEARFDNIQNTSFYLIMCCIFFCTSITIVISIEYYRNKNKN